MYRDKLQFYKNPIYKKEIPLICFNCQRVVQCSTSPYHMVEFNSSYFESKFQPVEFYLVSLKRCKSTHMMHKRQKFYYPCQKGKYCDVK